MPTEPAEAAEVVAFLNNNGSAATVSQIGGRYFGFVCGSVVPAGLAAKSLASFWDQNAGVQVLSPLSSKLETVVEGWLQQILGLPSKTVAGFVSGTSTANFCAWPQQGIDYSKDWIGILMKMDYLMRQN